MDSDRFDALARTVSAVTSRRGALAALLAAFGGSALTLPETAARLRKKKGKDRDNAKDKDKNTNRDGGGDKDRRGNDRKGKKAKGKTGDRRRRQARAAAVPRLCYNGSSCIPGPGKNLSKCDFSGTSALRNKNLRGANLGGANLTGADASGANFSGVNLGSACLTNADLTDAAINGSTNMGGAILCGTLFDDGPNNSGCDQPTRCCKTCTEFAAPCTDTSAPCCEGECREGICQCPAGQVQCPDGICRDCCTNGSRDDCDAGEVCCNFRCRTGDCCADGACEPDGNTCVDFNCQCGADPACAGATPTCCGEAPAGTCTDTDSDPDNCRACGAVCPDAQCQERTCTARDGCGLEPIDGEQGPDCRGAGQLCCDGVCKNTSTDPLFCGNCDTACPAAQCETATCTGGRCGTSPTTGGNCIVPGSNTPGTCCNGACIALDACCPACTGGLTCCGGACKNLQTDPQNCGECSEACQAGQCQTVTCSGGNCATSPTSGGSCTLQPGNVSGKCCNGACVSLDACCPACTGDLTCCGGACTNTDSDSQNCGRCGNVCTGGRTCDGGVCVCPADKPNFCSSLDRCEVCCGSGQCPVGDRPICDTNSRICRPCGNPDECVDSDKGNLCCQGVCIFGDCCDSNDCPNVQPVCDRNQCRRCSTSAECEPRANVCSLFLEGVCQCGALPRCPIGQVCVLSVCVTP